MRHHRFDDGRAFATGWFGLVPAYRVASLRVALAVMTIAFHVPKFNGLIDAYSASIFHVPPAFPWLPPLTRPAAMALMVLQHVAAWGLLLGWAPRACAWFLAVAGFYVMSLDPEFYAHNAQFHLTLLALIGCSTDRVSLRKLLADDGAEARCRAWPERLIRIQLVIVFLYTAIDKVLSPHWGTSGALLAAQRLVPHGPGLALLQKVNAVAFRAIPGVLSTLTIGAELFLAVAFLVRPLRRLGVVIAVVFAVYLEFILRPGLFAWDLLAALLVFAPAADRAWTALYDPTCPSCLRNRSMLARLDWLRRLRWVPAQATTAAGPRSESAGRARAGLHLVSPRGRAYRGFDALRALSLILPGPILVAMMLARFGGGFLSGRGYGRWDDLPFLVLALLLALWVPGIGRLVGHPVHAALAAGRHAGARLSLGEVGPVTGGCPVHARAPRS